jgi:thiol-disulfide isomerase/thioredoxin
MMKAGLTWLAIAVAASLMCGAAFAAPLGPGDTPPAKLGVDKSGDPTETAKFGGKVLVVTFWATWCGPCMKELPMLDGIQKVAGKDKLQVVAVNIEDGERFRKIAKALSSLNVTITNDYLKEASEAFGVKGIPHCAIIGRDGKIINVHRGYSEDALDSIIAEINEALARK